MYFDPKEVGSRIKRLRKQIGITQEQLAEKLNVTVNQLYRVEAGLSTGSVDLIVEISFHLDVSLDYLILGKEQPRDYIKEKVKALIVFLIAWLKEL